MRQDGARYQCYFNAFYLLCMRMMLERDRNLLSDTRKELVDKIDDILNEHALTGCPCIDKAMQQEVKR